MLENKLYMYHNVLKHSCPVLPELFFLSKYNFFGLTDQHMDIQ